MHSTYSITDMDGDMKIEIKEVPADQVSVIIPEIENVKRILYELKAATWAVEVTLMYCAELKASSSDILLKQETENALRILEEIKAGSKAVEISLKHCTDLAAGTETSPDNNKLIGSRDPIQEHRTALQRIKQEEKKEKERLKRQKEKAKKDKLAKRLRAL